MKIALVHDYLNDFGGAERVLKALREIFPKAPIYTIYFKKNSPCWQEFKNVKVIQSWFSYLPFCEKLISPLRFLIPLIWSSFDFSDYDLVITSASWAITKGMPARRQAGKKLIEICYIHTPPRYLYGYDTSRNWEGKWYSGIIKTYALVINHFMRMYDYNKAQEVDYFIVNSKNVGKRLEKFYRRKDYKVIYPPVDFEKFQIPKYKILDTNYYLAGGRLTAAKNFDLIIKACQKAKVKLKIYGDGIDRKRLEKIAGPETEFLGRVTDNESIHLYQNARAFIIAQKDEDFGITPVESMAAGTPVIAYRGGGYRETVVDGKTGIFFDELSVDSLVRAIKKFQKTKFNKKVLTNHTQKFSKQRFEREITKFVAGIHF